jgi:hypothetical protein
MGRKININRFLFSFSNLDKNMVIISLRRISWIELIKQVSSITFCLYEYNALVTFSIFLCE